MPRLRAVFAIFILLLAIGLPSSAQTDPAPAAAQSHSGAMAQETKRHQAAIARETKRHLAILARAEKRHQAVLARHQAALARLTRRQKATLAKHQARLARAEKKHQAALARLTKKRQMALAKHQAALAKAGKKHPIALAHDGKKQPAATAQASKAHSAATAQTPKKHHAATARSNAGLMKWLQAYYRGRDEGWAKNDLSKSLARTTSDYQYVIKEGQVLSRDQVIAQDADTLSQCAQSNTHFYQRTTIVSVALSGDTAVVTCYITMRANRQLTTNEGDAATLNAKSNKQKNRDTWVHLPEGWYLARTEEVAGDLDVDMNGHLNQ